tara:strand:- start:295 stop:780 length:486 start_codon:yes stop_codon:yes gene_type:complete
MNIINSNNKGYSISELLIAISIIGFLATLVIPNFAPALEFVEVLIAEKHLYKAVKECQLGLVNNESNPQYSSPNDLIGLTTKRNRRLIFSYTGILGQCLPEYGGNRIRITKVDKSRELYSLEINVITGEKNSEGKLPGWLDWWNGNFSPIIRPAEQEYFLK